jgi:IS1 family transposase/lambda repressor-like predicted transcriptional regulator
MRVIERERKVAIIHALCNGMSLRAASRTFNTHRTAIQNLLVRVGANCERLMAEHMRNVDCRYLELDELWTFCGRKERRLTPEQKLDPNFGDQYVFIAIDRETKVIPAWALGKRTMGTALGFLWRLKGTLNGTRAQISTDEWPGYEDAIEQVFGVDVDFGTVHKEYESVAVGPGRYAPPRVKGVVKKVQKGRPDEAKICTSIVKRNNLTIRTMQRRFTRLALGFSRKMENLRAAVALQMAYWNFCWIPRTLRITPAMAARVTDRVWEVSDLLGE